MNIKNKLKFLIVSIALTCCLNSLAQETIGDKYHDKRGRPIRYNIIKANLLVVPLGFYNLIYERKLDQRFSVVVDVTLFGKVPVSPFHFNSEGERNTQSISSSGYAISPEIRWYLGKHGSPRGYYLGLYVPIMHYNATGDRSTINQTSQQGENVVIPLQGSYSPNFTFYGLGLSGGPQFVISSRVTLEFYLNFALGIYSVKNANFYLNGDVYTPISTALPDGNYSGEALTAAGYPVDLSTNYTYDIVSNNGSQQLHTTYHKDNDQNRSGLFVVPRFGFTVGYAFGK